MSQSSRNTIQSLDATLSRLTLQELDRGGYLHLDSPFVDDLRVDIHPLFAPAQFENISAVDYELIRPSLRLASRFLAEASVIPYWHALVFGPRRTVRNFDLSLAYGRDLYRFDLQRDGLTTQDRHRVDAVFRALTQSLRITFAAAPNASYAQTLPADSRPGLPGRPGTQGSVIRINPDYLMVLRKAPASPTTLHDDPFLPAPTPASQLRTRFHLAKTLLHELCHALKWAATSPQPVRDRTRPQPPLEPFFGHQRLAETGRAWESTVLNGTVDPLGDDADSQGSDVAARWGLGVRKWPDLHDQAPPSRGPSRRPYGTTYAVPMAWVRGLWREGTWDAVRRRGVRELRTVRGLGVREQREREWDGNDEGFEFLSQAEGDGEGDEGGFEGYDERERMHRRNLTADWKVEGMDDEWEGWDSSDSSDLREADDDGVIRPLGPAGDDAMEVEPGPRGRRPSALASDAPPAKRRRM